MKFRRTPVALLLLAGCASAPSFAPAPKDSASPSQPPVTPVLHIRPPFRLNPPVPPKGPITVSLPPPSPPAPPVIQNPTVSISADPTSITAGDASTLTIVAANETSVALVGSDGIIVSSLTDGPVVVSPSATTTYIVTATGAAGSTPATATVTLTVVPAVVVPPPPVSPIPTTAVSSGILDGSARWEWNHDPGTAGTSSGTTEYPVAMVSTNNPAREMDMTYTDYGGEIWHLSFGTDSLATHFVYDTYVMLVNPAQVANLEMDMNQVIANGDTVIFGMQCASGSGTWEYTTQTNAAPHWHPSNLPCNPKTWGTGWHHVQIASERTSNAGDVTYDWVCLDGTYSYFVGASGNSALSLGWSAADLLLNFQIDGSSKTGGSLTAYTDQMQVWRW